MQLATTFRGLSDADQAKAERLLDRSTGRLSRLLEEPVSLRAVVEGGPPEHKVSLKMAIRGSDLSSTCNGHDLAATVASAVERLKVQIVRTRERRESQRHRQITRA